MIRKLLGVTLIAATVFAAGCASVPKASSDQDARAKTFAVAPGKANIYVYRNEILGASLSLPVVHNGRSIGNTGPKSFYLLEVAPGNHRVSTGEPNSEVSVAAQAGKNYFVWQEVKMGFMAGKAQLQVVDEAKGKAGVAESSLISIVR